MSEYQYYEFQAVDRRLTDKEMDTLRRSSTRAEITPTSFRNEYAYGDFRGKEDAWMEKYFDAYIHMASWGTSVLQLRLPSGFISLKAARQYCPGDSAKVREKSGHLIFTFTCNDEEGGGWIDGDGIMSGLLPIRDELARGDLRALYVGWLLCVQQDDLDEDSIEPPVPPNLSKPSKALSNLIDFLRIDDELLSVAVEASVRTATNPTTRPDVSAWVAALDQKEKDKLLVRLLEEEPAAVGTELRARFNRYQIERAPRPQWQTDGSRRKVGELLAAFGGSSSE